MARVLALVDSDQPETILNRLQPLANIAPLYNMSRVVVTSYASVIGMAYGGEQNGQGEPASRSGLIRHITPAFAAAAARLIHSGTVHYLQFRSVGGAVADVDPDATAYANRAANFSVSALGVSSTRLNAAWDKLHPHFEGLYLNFDTDLRPERLGDAFPPRTLSRLRKLKSRYDPTNLFRDNFNIAPEETPTDAMQAGAASVSPLMRKR
jgi:hypothetical protein